MTTTPPVKPGFDRLIVSVLVAIGLALLAIAFVGCNPAARQCRRAEKLIDRAVYRCPELMLPQVRVDTIIKWTEPTAVAGSRMYSQSSMDSLATMCSDLLSVYRGEADLSTWKYAELQRVKMQNTLCDFAPIDTTDGPCGLRIWPDHGRVGFFHHKAAERVDTVYRYVDRTIDTGAAKPEGRVRSPFWIAVLWLFIGLVLGFFFGLFIRGSHRYQ